MTDVDPTQEGLAATASLHLTTAQVLLTEAESLADTTAQDLSVAEIVAQANVHARIAHASAALAMLTPRSATQEQAEAEKAPGLAVLEKLAKAIDRLASRTGYPTGGGPR